MQIRYLGPQHLLVAGMVLLGLWLGYTLGSGKPGYWIVAIQTVLVIIFAVPDVFLGFYQSGILNNIGYLPDSSDVRFFPIMTLLAAVAYLARRWPRLPRLAPNWMILSQVALLALFAWGVTYSSEPERGQTFAVRFVYYHLLFCAVPLIFHDDPASLRRVIYAFGGTCTIISLIAVWAYDKVASGAVEIFAQVLWADERAVGTGAVFMVWLLFERKRLGVMRFPVAILFAVFFFGLVLLGRRGVLIGTVLAVFLCVMLAGRLRPRAGAGLALVAAALVISVQLIPEFQRTKLFDEESYTYYYSSAQIRSRSYDNAMAQIQESPLVGFGTGAGSIPGMGEGITPYMHNIFLEIAYQVGIIGVLVFTFFLLTVAHSALRTLKDNGGGGGRRGLGILLLAWFIMWFTPAQLSFDLLGNRTLWFLAGLMGALARSQPALWQARGDTGSG